MSNDPGQVAALFDLAATEPQAMDELRHAVQRLEQVQDAKVALAKLPSHDLRAGLLHRRGAK